MICTYNGSLENLIQTITDKASAQKRDIIVYHNDSDILEIGFHRLGHNGGRFYIANISESDGTVSLSGRITDVFNGKAQDQRSTLRKVIHTVDIYLVGYLMLVFIPLLAWLGFFQFKHIWIPLLIPILWLMTVSFFNRRADRKTDAQFVEFLASFMTVQL